MKPPRSGTTARLMPASVGWRLRTPSGVPEEGMEVGELSGRLGSGGRVEMLLPSASLVLERLLLPEAPKEELQSMAQLQLEKLLPYASEEFLFELEETGRNEDGQLELLALSVSRAALESTCRELRESERGPVAMGVYVRQLAAALREETGRILMVWQELERPFVAIVEKGRLCWLEGLPTTGSDWAEMEISKALLSAELARVSVEISKAIVSMGSPEWAQAVRRALPGVAVEESELRAAEEIEGQWMPEEWAKDEEARSKSAALWERLQWVGLVYLLVLTLGFGWLAFQKAGLRRLDAQLAQLQPEVEASKASQNRWIQLQPAADSSRFLVEILAVIQGAIGPADIKITEFKMGVREFSIAGEAASLAEAIEYAGRLKKDPGFSGFQIQSPNPNILPNERAQFRISAKADSGLASPSKR